MTDEDRHQIELWLKSAMRYGWKIATLGFDQPDPLFDWSDGWPRLVTDGNQLEQP